MTLRIVRARYKLLYFLAWGGLNLLLATRVYPYLPFVLVEIIGNAVFVVVVYVAIRSFRGAREPLEPERAWWRMTATVRSSVVMASVVAVITVLGVLSFTIWSRVPLTSERIVDLILDTVEYLTLAALYVNSAVRLHRSPDPVTDVPVTTAPPIEGLD